MNERSRVPWLAPLFALIVALYCRLAVVPERLGLSGVIFPGPDSHYHARRVIYGLTHFPRIITTDHALAAVEPPMRCPWPPLYDTALTLYALPCS